MGRPARCTALRTLHSRVLRCHGPSKCPRCAARRRVQRDPARLFRLNYLEQYGNRIAPTFIAKAGLDSTRLNATIDRFVEEAQRSAAPVELMVHSQGHHGFDVLDDNERSREIIRHTLDFVRRWLKDQITSG